MSNDLPWPQAVEIARLTDELARSNEKIRECARSAIDWRVTAREYRAQVNAVRKLLDEKDPSLSYVGPFGGTLFHEDTIRKALESGTSP
ncbi:hypothetical protein [Rhodococcoides fascians]|uniref:hypothetical protein n=1 Tax=Rhodococcoides fascians TaxID=1828 RepID=UPI000569DEAF|nr:hypothetical protein [Rhodococcus fascians]